MKRKILDWIETLTDEVNYHGIKSDEIEAVIDDMKKTIEEIRLTS